MTQAGPVSLNAPPDPVPPVEKPLLPKSLTFVALAALLGYIAVQSQTLLGEWHALTIEREGIRKTSLVGYANISPNPSYARRPSDWFHHEKETTLLWSGWRHGVGHGWFRVKRGEVEQAHISVPFGRDVVRAIDYPIVEVNGGTIWSRIPDGDTVFGENLAGVVNVYPLNVLNKVEVINDQIGERPFLITFNPWAPGREAVSIYDPVLDGQRLTLGHAGYIHQGRPLLYDRGTESLWVADTDALIAIGGPLRGSRLPRLAQPSPVTWSQWRSQHPKSRLVVGADRSKAVPTL
jgi:hypothetical protein